MGRGLLVKTLNALMRHLREHGVETRGSVHKQRLKNYGYYHGCKGYRFVGSASKRLQISSFDEVIALNQFDMRLKSLLCPHVMFIETALKNYTLEATLSDAGSSSIDAVFSKSLTSYRDCAGSRHKYAAAMAKRLRLRSEINSLIAYNYEKSPVVSHFYDCDKSLPLWAVFEIMTLGNFGVFYSCLNSRVRANVAKDLGLPANFDSPALLEVLIFALKDLRNAIAHNGAIYDVRFKRAKINGALGQMVYSETGVDGVDFTAITDYVVLIVYLLRKMGVSKTECIQLVRECAAAMESLRKGLSIPDCHKILQTNARAKLSGLRSFISRS